MLVPTAKRDGVYVAKLVKLWRLSGPRQNSYLSAVYANRERVFRRYQQKYQQSHRRRLDSRRGALCVTLSRRPEQKYLEIWRYTLFSACEPCLARLWLSPSLSPEHTLSWRQRWRYGVGQPMVAPLLANCPQSGTLRAKNLPAPLPSGRMWSRTWYRSGGRACVIAPCDSVAPTRSRSDPD